MMAGQIKEPVTISFSFQAESVHSGSISFGRFAHEPLLWERRSSFSHNRIQEEVARCSKHRIVTEKKAYFEAQFKKKALLRQCSLDEQSGKQFGAGEQEYPHMRSHKDINDLSQGNNNDASSESSIYRGFKEDFDYEEEAQVNVHFDETSDASNDFDEAMEYHIEGREILISEPVMLASSDSVEVKAKVDAGIATAADSQTVIDCTYSRCSSAEHDLEVEKNIDAHVSFVEEDCKAIDLSAGCWKSDKEPDAVLIHSVVCPKIVVAIEPSGTESNGKVARTQRDSLCKAAKVSSTSSSFKMLEKPRVLEAKTSKQSNLSPSPANKMMRSPYPEHLLAKSTSSISKTMSGRNSGIKELRVAKVAKSPVTTVIKDVPKTLQSPNRTKKVTAPKISSLKTCPTSLQLRSGMRADKRKEMPSRVGQPQASHIQKPVINRTRARTQDKTLDEIKQVRRSSSIKPKPMQSLHSKDEKLVSEKKDAIERTPQMKPSNPRTKVLTRSSVNKKTKEGRPLNSLSQVSTRTSYPATRSSAVSSLINKSTRPSSIKDAVSTIRVTGNDKLKNKTAQPKVDAMKGRETISKISPTTGNITTKRTVRKLIDKPRDARNASLC